VGEQVRYWLQPTAAARSDFLASMRASRGARALAIGWVVVAAVLAWRVATQAHVAQPWFERLLVLPLALYFLMGAVHALSLLLPLGQVRLEPDRIRYLFGKQQTVHPLADMAAYRVAVFPKWRTLTLVKVDGTSPAFNVPLQFDPDDIHRYFAEHGVPEAEDR
jgi:hypothetical protein